VLITSSHFRRARRTNHSPEDGPLHVAVLMGGVGPERAVSMTSGREVAQALEDQGHRVEAWVLDSDRDEALDDLPRDVDVVFLALHGEYGEDGRVQQALAARDFTYTGSGPEASARAFDKLRAKRILARAGIPLATHQVLEMPCTPRDVKHLVRLAPLGPTVVKPVSMGSSVGVAMCRNRSQLARALEEGQAYGQTLLVEEFIPGHELTVAILDDAPLPLVEIVPLSQHYDYQAKYDARSGTTYQVEPQHLRPEVREEARRIALWSHRALGCSEFSRVDLRYDPTKDQLVVLEVNTIPGLTPTSLLPKAAQAGGLSFGQLVTFLCRLALRTRQA
jgi:D-alanine-D-alanine ligase